MVLRKLGNGNCCVLLLFALFIMCFLEVLIVILFVSLVLNLCGKLNSPVLLLNWLPTWNACCCCCCCCCCCYISHSLFRLLGYFGSLLSNVVLQSFIFQLTKLTLSNYINTHGSKCNPCLDWLSRVEWHG